MTHSQPLKIDIDAKIMNVVLKEIENEMGLPPGYLTGLRGAESDWDFIVKIGLFLEAIVARAIALEMGRPLTYERINNENHRDRLNLAKKIKLIDTVELRMLEALSELRNAFVHRLENLTRPLEQYFIELSGNRQRQIAKAILAAGVPGRLGKSKDSQAITEFPNDFRRTVLSAIFPTLLNLGYGHKLKQREKRYIEWRSKQEQIYGGPLPPRIDDGLTDRIMVMNLLSKKKKAIAVPK